MLLEQTGQRGTTGETAETLHKGLLNVRPLFARSVLDCAGLLSWPLTGSLMMCIGPSEDLIHSQPWKILNVPHSTLLRSAGVS
jgi:hypothetical protein